MANSKMSLLNKLETIEPVWLMVAEKINYQDLLNIEKSGTFELDDDGHAYMIDMAFRMMDTLIVTYGECLNEILSVIKRCRKLKRVKFSYVRGVVREYELRQVGQLLAKHCPMLEQLQCDRADLQVLMTSYLDNLETKSTNLRKISVHLSDNSEFFIKLLKMSPLLEQLTLAISGGDSGVIIKLVNVLSAVAVDGKCFPNLEKLTIVLFTIIPVNIRPIFNFFDEVDTLKINLCRVSEEKVNTLRAINTMQQFKHVELNGTDEHLIQLFDPSTLTSLDIYMDKIPMALINELMKLDNLQQLTASCMSFETLGTIGRQPSLKRLRIPAPQDEPKWWTALDELLHARPSLVVELSSIGVSRANSKHIYEIIERNPKNLFTIGAITVKVKEEEDLIMVKKLFMLVNVRQVVVAVFDLTCNYAERQSLIEYYDNLRIEKEVLDLERISNKVLMIRSD